MKWWRESTTTEKVATVIFILFGLFTVLCAFHSEPFWAWEGAWKAWQER